MTEGTLFARIRQIVWRLSPASVRNVYIRLKLRVQGQRREWEYVSQTWVSGPDNHGDGWNARSIVNVQVARWPSLVDRLKATAPFSQALEAVASDGVDLAFHNSVMSFGYTLGLAAQSTTSLSFLDWGGGVGQYRLYAQSLFPALRIEYHCRDLPSLVAHGRDLHPDAHFYDDDTCLLRKYDYVLASSSLQYSPDWGATLRDLARATKGYLFITLLPTVQHAPSYTFIQRPYRYGYNTEYRGWCINQRDLLRCAELAGLTLLREFYIGFEPWIYRAPEPCVYRGFLFSRADEQRA